jgi:hypothetical protein
MKKIRDHAEMTEWWKARTQAFEAEFGPMDDMVRHSNIPFEMGEAAGGLANVVYFRQHVPGVLAVTSELIGVDGQVPNGLGNYELAICRRGESEWCDYMISRMAHYTFKQELAHGDVMDIRSIVPSEATVSALLFLEFARFEVKERDAGVLLCLGITPDELAACRGGRTTEVLEALSERDVFPFTDLYRPSVLAPN